MTTRHRPILKLLRSTGALPSLAPNWRQQYFQLTFRDRPVGWVNKNLAAVLAAFPQNFTARKPQVAHIDQLEFKASSQAEINKIVQSLYERKVFTGWRGEEYAARALDGKHETLFTVERAAARVFGLVRHSIHVNGFLNENGTIKYWMGKRSSTKSRFPGMLDNVVAGGLPVGYSPLECAVKECWEEASIDEEIARKRLKCTGSITRCCEEEGYLSLEEIFLFDMDMSDVTPKPKDGEVESFTLFTCEDVIDRLAPQVKPDVLIVLADFMVRNNLVDPTTDPIEFLDLVRAMHEPIPSHVNGLTSLL